MILTDSSNMMMPDFAISGLGRVITIMKVISPHLCLLFFDKALVLCELFRWPVYCLTKYNLYLQIIREAMQMLHAKVLQLNLNSCLAKLEFPKEVKAGDVSALFKNTDTLSKKNYRPITVLPPISKIFERIMYEQMMTFVTSFLSNFLCRFRKGYNTQHALLNLIEKCKRVLDKKGYAGAILMDLSKAFDCLDHELLLAKLDAYGFSKNALRFIYSYLTDRKQRVKVNGTFSEWQETKLGVPQGSVLGPLLFNIYINDLFYLLKDTDICNYANDTTILVCDNQLENIQNRLEQDALELSGWFRENYMKLNDDKCHLLVFGDIPCDSWQFSDKREH